METRLPVIAEVEGLGRIVEANRDFYTNHQLLAQEGARPISPRDEAYARLATRGKEDVGKNYGTFTSAGFEHARGQLPILRLESRLLTPKLARLAVEANRNGKYLHTDSTREYEESFAQAQEDANRKPRERKVILLPSRESFVMSDKENWEVFEAIFKDQAKPYFKLNGPIYIYPVNKDIVDSDDRTLLTQAWFRGLGSWSGLYGDIGGLYCDYRLRGVKKSAEGTSPKIMREEQSMEEAVAGVQI